MKIAIVGTGYVGLVSGACFAEMGVDVMCVDIDAHKIENIRRGVMPIYEPGLAEMVARNIASERLSFATTLSECIDSVDIVFIAVGTPPMADGSADVKAVLAVANEFAEFVRRDTLLVVKSTVPVGTCERVKMIIEDTLQRRGVDAVCDVASNPEFLKEGDAIRDFMSPDRVVVGVETERARKLMTQLYRPFLINNFRVLFMDVASAEMTKYASNAMLATRISFMNDIANLCELVGADVDMVRHGVGSDSRIGKKFLYPGCGYGGSCFPKDVKALIKTAEQNGYEMRVLKAVEDVNERQKSRLFDKLCAQFDGDIRGKRIAIWGLAFKPETDDMREAPSLVIIDKLLGAGCNVSVYDPAAMSECQRRYGSRLIYAKDMYSAAEGVDALLLLTEWKEFRMPDFHRLAQIMRTRILLDGRNIYESADVRSMGLTYFAIGKC